MNNPTISNLQTEVHAIAKEKGWWDGERPIPELLMLIVTEAAEAMEAYRKGLKTPEVAENFAEELADIVIRVFDMAEGYDIDLEWAILAKIEQNRGRPWRHGGKRC